MHDISLYRNKNVSIDVPNHAWYIYIRTKMLELTYQIMHRIGELGYDGLNGTRKIGPSYAKSVVYI